MSGPVKMTWRQYLEARGWTSGAPRYADHWRDPAVARDAQDGPNGSFDAFMVPTSDALTIQRARDAEEERAAWVRFAAPLQHRMTPEVTGAQNLAAHHADAMLRLYRARLSVEIVAERPDASAEPA